jgi:uncharacterized membrane protein YgcG
MKTTILAICITFLTAGFAFAQTGKDVHGIVTDSTKLTLPSSSVTLTTEAGDSTSSVADINGKFLFQGVKGTKITITVRSIGFQSVRRHYTLTADNSPADLGAIVLKVESKMLSQVNIVGVIPIVIKEDTVQYQASAYKVRDNAPAEDLIKKLPGVDVDVNGNITTQGKQVTKVRINGKDFMGGDVQAATKNLPADVIENIQMIDDYGDQANLTGVKTGEPDKIMNITIRKDKNYGYVAQATAGDGEDALPPSQGIPDQNRYLGSVNAFRFNGDQQVALLGSINNTNVNTFSFGGATGGGGGVGGGGGRGNAGRAQASSSGLTTTQNGITDAHSIGLNFRDQWGKALSVYGSYSFADNTVTTNTNTNQQNISASNPSVQKQSSVEKDQNINHRFTWNMEYKPDTVNYLKVTPTFSYAGTNTNEFESDNFTFSQNAASNRAYTQSTLGDSQAPSYGITALFNHRFKHHRNLSINVTLSAAPSWSFQNPIYDYTAGAPTAPLNQFINTYSRTNSYGTTLSYLEPIGKKSYLELNYAFNRAATTNDKTNDTLYFAPRNLFKADSALSTLYNYTFTTNKVGLSYRFIDKKYNYTLGVAVQPSVLDGYAPITNVTTHQTELNVIPTARFVYNFSRSKSFNINYNGSSSTPSFSQLQPIIDFSDASYPVEGNPNLKPQFTNNFSIRYNNFSIATGDVFFVNYTFTSISNQVVSNTTTFPSVYTPDKRFENTILTQYTNADGYYTTSARINYAKPWENRKYTLYLNALATYTNNIAYITNITSLDSTNYSQNTQKNVSKNLALTPEVRFRLDITDKVDVQALTNYVISKTDNSVNNALTSGSADVRTWNLGLNGKNYFGDWTVSYDFTKATNYGYASSLKVTNPNLLNMYVERRFLKDHRATIRLSAFDLFNQNTGYTNTPTGTAITETQVNRLARYYLATFTLKLQKFAGKAPTQEDGRGFRRNGNGGGGRNGGGGFGGPGGGGPPGGSPE